MGLIHQFKEMTGIVKKGEKKSNTLKKSLFLIIFNKNKYESLGTKIINIF